MGKFGKRVLIVTLSVLLVLALVLIGNAIEKAGKNHKVSAASSVVYKGSYDGVNYSITKGDVWEYMISSNPIATVLDMVDEYLLSELIEAQTNQEEIDAMKHELTYGDSYDAMTAQQRAEALMSFENKMTVLGYTEATGKKSVDYYVKTQLAYKAYAKYRLEEGKTIGGLSYDFSEDKLREEYEDTYADVAAVIVRFTGTDEATDFFRTAFAHKFEVVSSRLRMYVADSQYVLAKNSNSSYYLNDDFTPALFTQLVNGSFVNVPYGNILYNSTDSVYYTFEYETGKFAWVFTGVSTDKISDTNNDQEEGKWSYKESDNTWNYKKDSTIDTDADRTISFTSSSVAYEDATSYSSTNTAYISDEQLASLFIKAYNIVYAQQKQEVNNSAKTYADFEAAIASDLSVEEDFAKVQKFFNRYGLAIVDNAGSKSIMKYVGNSSYLLALDDQGNVIVDEDGYATYKTTTYQSVTKSIPSYKLVLDGEDNPTFDSEGAFIYELDQDGNKIRTEGYKPIDEQDSFTISNCIPATNSELYAAYIAMIGESFVTDAFKKSFVGELVYSQADMEEAGLCALADELFDTLDTDSMSTSITTTFTNYAYDSSSYSSPYYVIYKIAELGKADFDFDSFKASKVEEYLEKDGIVDTCLAELRKEAGFRLYDEFLGYAYDAAIKYDSDDNTTGPSDTSSYYTYKNYNAKKIFSLKKCSVMGHSKGKWTVIADDLYDYAMDYSKASYIASTALAKVLVSLPEFTALHGTDKNYLTSKNWKYQEYAEATENYNYYFEYYKSIYTAYGMADSFYSTLNEFLYSNSLGRSLDDAADNLMKATMLNFFLYKALTGNTLSEQAGVVTDSYLKEIMDSEKWVGLSTNYYSVIISHVLFSIDLDQDGSPDSMDDFVAEFDETTGEHPTIKDELGNALTLAKFNQYLDELYDDLQLYLDNNPITSSSVTSITNYVNEYVKSSLVDGDYKKYKAIGIVCSTDSLESSSYNYDSCHTKFVERFANEVDSLAERLYRIDNEILGYSLSDSLTMTEFGYHYVVVRAGSDYEKLSFKVEGETICANDNDAASYNQIAEYLRQIAYTAVYGDTDSPEKHAGFAYPTVATEVTDGISQYYSTMISVLFDQSSSYHSAYIMLKALAAETATGSYQDLNGSFAALRDVYFDLLFGDLS